jgi:hypothetical protein
MNFLKSNKDKTGGIELGSHWCGVDEAHFCGWSWNFLGILNSC